MKVFKNNAGVSPRIEKGAYIGEGYERGMYKIFAYIDVRRNATSDPANINSLTKNER